jgi:uncharacterized membrane protein YphA (DoxX/SURF4 family)
LGPVFGLAISASGYGKLGGIPTTAYFTSLGMSPPELWPVAAIVEVILGAALILGIATRYAALASFVGSVATALRIATGHIQRRNRLVSITTG